MKNILLTILFLTAFSLMNNVKAEEHNSSTWHVNLPDDYCETVLDVKDSGMDQNKVNDMCKKYIYKLVFSAYTESVDINNSDNTNTCD